MKTKYPIAVLIGWFAVVLVPFHSLPAADAGGGTTPMASGTGIISGRVSSTKTGGTLQGAIVEIPALNRQELTDNGGRFTLTGLPPGVFDLVVSYTGLKEERRQVVVGAASQPSISIELAPADIITMDKFTVASEREGNALAVTSQRNAPNLKNVLAMDAFGNPPNMGVADVAMRMPGVAPEYDGEGIPSRVSIRGLPTSMTTTTVDGDPVFRGNGVRWASLYGMSASTYEQIELIKGRTPDESANSLGGGLNLRSRSPLSMTEKRRINYNVGMRWVPRFLYQGAERREHPMHPSMTLGYQEAFGIAGGERNFGVGLGLHYSENVNSADQETYIYQNLPSSPAYIYDYRSFTQENNRGVRTLDLRTEYRPSSTTRFYLGGTWNQGNEPFFDQSQIRFFTSQTLATIGPNGQPTGTGTILPGFTETRTQVRAQPASTAVLTQAHYSFIATSPTVNFGGEHKLNRWDIDYRLAHTHMHIDRGQGKGHNEAGGVLAMQATNIGWIIDRANSTYPQFTQTEGRSIYDPATYTAGTTFTFRDEVEQTWAFNGRLNAAYRFDTRIPLTWKSGLAYERRDNHLTIRGNTMWNRVASAPPLPNVPIFKTTFDERQGGRMPVVDPRAVYGELTNASLWTEDLNYKEVQKLSRSKTALEEIGSVYTMLNAKIDHVAILAGVRTERTDDSGKGNVRIKPATVAEIPDPVARARHDWSARQTNEGRYTRTFPSVHVTYDVTPELKARASWSTSFGRPDFLSMAPAATISDTAQTVTISNPALGPQYAKNLDLTLNYYFKPAGYFSIGYFDKKITDYILTAETGIVPNGPDNGYQGDYAGYRIFTSVNAGSATVKGWEFDYRQQFTFLPGLLKGFELAANYTKLKTNGDFGGTSIRRDTEVAGFVPKTANASVAYNYGRYGTRVNFNYQSDYLSSYNVLPEARLYNRVLRTVDVSLIYRLRTNLTLSCDMNNVLKTRRAQYQWVPGRIRGIYVPGQAIVFRLSGSL